MKHSMADRRNSDKKKKCGSFIAKIIRPKVAPPPPPIEIKETARDPSNTGNSELNTDDSTAEANPVNGKAHKHERKRKSSQSKELKRSSSKFYVELKQDQTQGSESQSVLPGAEKSVDMAATDLPSDLNLDLLDELADSRLAQMSPRVRKTALFFEAKDASAKNASAVPRKSTVGISLASGSGSQTQPCPVNQAPANPVAPKRRVKRIETMDCQHDPFSKALQVFNSPSVNKDVDSSPSPPGASNNTTQAAAAAASDQCLKKTAVDFLKYEWSIQMRNKEDVAENCDVPDENTEPLGVSMSPAKTQATALKDTSTCSASPPKPQILRPKPRVEMRQTRVKIQSFTTEDFDICQSHMNNTSPESSNERVPRKDIAKKPTDLTKINVKRRSRSLGGGPNLELMSVINRMTKPILPEKPKPKRILPDTPVSSSTNQPEQTKRILPNVPTESSTKVTKESRKLPPKPRALPSNPILKVNEAGSRRSRSKSPNKSESTSDQISKRSESLDSGLDTIGNDTVIVDSALYGVEHDNGTCMKPDEEIELPSQTCIDSSPGTTTDHADEDSRPKLEVKNDIVKSSAPKVKIDLSEESNHNHYEDGSLTEDSESTKSQTVHSLPVKLPRTKSNLKNRLRKSFRKRVYEDVELQDDIPEDASEEELDFSISADDDNSFSEDSFTDDEDEFEKSLSEGVVPVYENHEPTRNEPEEVESPEPVFVPKDKLHQIANEILTTERAYVARLHLIDQVFHLRVLRENREQKFFPDNFIQQIFINVKSIYQFHDFLLSELEKRMQVWDDAKKIGDIMMRWAPFLKLYTEYINKFDNSMNTFNMCLKNYPKFGSIVDEVQAMTECGHLTLQHHMLGPIQRLPRYELLLKDYLKHLESDSDDEQDTQKALELVTKAAAHANETIRKNEKTAKLLSLSERLIGGSSLDLISPTRELVKEGHITKISARDGSHLSRYLFLFTDVLIVCVPVQFSKLGILKQQYKIKIKLDIEGMRVMEGDDLFTPNTFQVKSKTKSIEFHASDIEDKDAWQTALWGVISDYTKKKLSRNTGPSLLENFQEDELGKRAPTWIKDQAASMCMLCAREFTTFFRRHHCRACGQVICGNCSSRKTRLKYDNNKYHRVCDTCYNTLELKITPDSKAGDMLQKTKGRRAVKADDISLIKGYLHMSQNKKHWDRRYFAIRSDFVLYSFKAHQDLYATTSLPLPGYIAAAVKDESQAKFVFKLFHIGLKKEYYFQAQDRKTVESWLCVLDKVVRAELPDDTLAITLPEVHVPVPALTETGNNQPDEQDAGTEE